MLAMSTVIQNLSLAAPVNSGITARSARLASCVYPRTRVPAVLCRARRVPKPRDVVPVAQSIAIPEPLIIPGKEDGDRCPTLLHIEAVE
jgi:hypothetical protein